jgi:urease accessory protein
MTIQYLKSVVYTTLLYSFVMPAAAHTGVGATDDFVSGLMHPWQGLDHIIVMVAIGLWGCLLVKRLVWQLPASFLLAMLGGATINLQGLTLSFAEQWINLSVIVFSLIVVFKPSLSSIVAIGIVSFFAIYHGYVHTAEIEVGANPYSYIAGFLLSTTILHGLGIALGFLYLANTDQQTLLKPRSFGSFFLK